MLSEWLRAAGLGHLAQAFEAHKLELTDLKDLTEAELREIGLTVGERKRFRRALDTATKSAASGERRPMTLAFIDLVDSSALAEELEAEDMVEVLRQYRKLCSVSVARYGGHVAQFIGDGIFACFGYPEAHENAAERAVRAAVEISAAVRQLETPARRPLAVRSGIATGRVVVTGLFPELDGQQQSFTGSTSNLAARLQALAPPNGIVLSRSTALRVRHLFELTEMGEHRLKGFPKPVPVFSVRCERVRQSSTRVVDLEALTPFVDRTAERRTLLRLWKESLEVGGRAALISGEPGIGKSRLVTDILRSLAGDRPPRVVRIHGSALDAHSPLRPFLTYFGGKTESQRTADVDAALAAAAGPLSGHADMPLADPAVDAARRSEALRTLVGHFVEIACQEPTLVAVEDAHWLDASSKELLTLLVPAARSSPLMVLVTSRASVEETFPALDRTQVRELPLAALGQEDVREMIGVSFGDEVAPSDVIARITDHADGVPLFVEELLRSVLHLESGASWPHLPAGATRPAAVPESLQDALAARLDSLGAAKKIAQVAAVIGRAVDLPTLARVMRQPEEDVEAAVGLLFAAGVFRAEPPEGRRYAFTHALLRDAAYDGLLREERQRLHAAAADALRETDRRLCADRPDILAWHLTEGGREAEAIPCWLAAGRSAAARSALHEARHALERGTEIAARLPESTALIETRLEFASLLGPVLFALCGPGSPESRSLYESAAALAQKTPGTGAHFPVLWGSWRLSRDFRVKAGRARMLMRIAEHHREREMLLQAHHCNWASAFHTAEFEASRQHIEAGLAVYDQIGDEHRPWLFGNHDAGVCAHGELAQVLWMQGRAAEALEHERLALDWAARKDHAGTQAHAFDLALLHRYYRREAEEVRHLAERMIALADNRGMPENRARGRLFLGWSLAHQGDLENGLRIFEESYKRRRAVGTNEDTPVYACMFAEILNRVGRHDLALAELHEVNSELDRLGICNWTPEIWRLIGETTLRAASDAVDDARTALDRAATLASCQRVPMLELRTAIARARSPVAVPADRSDVERLRGLVSGGEECVDLRGANDLLQSVREEREILEGPRS